MKLFHLRRTGPIGYDENTDMIVRAPNESEARKAANGFSADEGQIWDNPKKVSCEVLTIRGDEGVILTSFNAG